ncbi:MAG: hypothetical protein Kow0042_10090 [Calditrichia bacterium]
MKRSLCLFLLPGILIILTSGCSHRIYQVAYPTLNDGKYDSEFPYKNSSTELQKITETVRKINAIAYYKSYIFPLEKQVTPEDLLHKDFTRLASKEIFYNNSVIGSATVINYSRRHVVLMTCAHVVDFPDTVITYHEGTRFLQSFSLKKRQSNFVADLPEKGELEILAIDPAQDIVLLGRRFEEVNPQLMPVFNYPFGKAKDLEWGSFVYMVGYPKGYQMITKGIVSQPNRDKSGSFIVDALFNKGFSGGIVLAIRDGVPNFELVGMASSVAADFEYLLYPQEDLGASSFDPHLPYQGEIFVKLNKVINYGITFVTSAEAILEFIKDNQSRLLEKGYDLSNLFMNQ